ncbi:SDR family NAD(P)-dependent oxidoreductase [Herbaspirillum sp. HC18]|nr:SDR family NAD(P)-dependent oxidoreductase [Herbaspirillum sp. HC18]
MRTMSEGGGAQGFAPHAGDGQSLVEAIERHAKWRPDGSALIFLKDGEDDAVSLSYAELYRQSSSIACHLSAMECQGKRMLLLLPSCLEYVTAFLGCLMAGVIAVPLYSPRHNWHGNRLAAIARDAEAEGVITLSNFISGILNDLKQAGAPEVETIIPIDALSIVHPLHQGIKTPEKEIAYLQYTSGSTGSPKGVIVRHGDILRNVRRYADAVGLKPGETAVSWLPLYHDMGLVQGIFMPLAVGGIAVFMPPATFLQKPVRWLHAISRYGAAFSGAPNFAYEACVQNVPPADMQGLDLAKWRIAINAAEPISTTTLEAFATKFAPAGFHKDALVGGYGMAEATLYVTADMPGHGAPVLHLDGAALEGDRVVLNPVASERTFAVVSSGHLTSDPVVRIVNPHTRQLAEPDLVGEIWVAGSSVCTGYWKPSEENAETFDQVLAGEEQYRFLRTGDLGFAHDGHLYVTGRLKDLIIIRGANHYPQDIEHDAEAAHPSFRRGGFCAAFAWDDCGSNRVVVVQEVKRTERHEVDINEAGECVVKAIAARHGIEVDLVVLVEPAGIPKTSSGKIQRKACRQLLQSGEIKEIGRWQRPQHDATSRPMSFRPSPFEIETLLCRRIADLTGLQVQADGREARFVDLGLDSAKLVQLTKEIGRSLDVEISPAVAFEHPSVASLSLHLAGMDKSLSDPVSLRAEPVAIVGMACRLPGARDIGEYWDLLVSGRSEAGEVSATRQALTGYRAGANDPYRFIAELPDVDRFDAALFGIAPREAVSMDPQQRLMLEVAWHAFEHAGIAPDSLAGTATGVFAGVSSNDYFRLQKTAGHGHDTYSGTGGALSITANRLSYCFGLQGPSMTIDTACSSSLVAVHQACLSLAAGECDLALAGGVNLVLSDELGAVFTQARMLSPEGRCRTFDQKVDGYVRGEGCGAVVLKRLRDAERDGDRVLAVIRGSAVNQDGRSNGLTAPSGSAQRQVIRAALKRAGCAPGTIGFVETHGSGTPLGDPIEVEALKAELDAGIDYPCSLGAVKTQIGHLESAAGIAGLIKAVLVLQHGQIPPNHGYESLNRHIDLQESRLRVADALKPWAGTALHPRRAGISAFGFGGTNVHVILEECTLPATASVSSHSSIGAGLPMLLNLSANSEASLRSLAARYAARFSNIEANIATELCRLASRGRAHLAERLSLVASDATELAEQLQRFCADGKTERGACFHGRSLLGARRVAFLFTGQGSHHARMGLDLYGAEPLFRQHIDYCDTILRPLLDVSLTAILNDAEGQYLRDTRFAQPTLVALEVGIARLWQHYGVTPDLVLGHSVGEYAAACVAGIITLEQALPLVAERGRLMASAPGRGGMLSVAADALSVEAVLTGRQIDLDIAGFNTPRHTVLSGRLQDVENALEAFQAAGMDAQRLEVCHAFHSRLMEPILPQFRAALEQISFHKARIPFTPSASCSSSPESPAYWLAQLREPVQFMSAMHAVAAAGVDAFIETGPTPVLLGFGRRILESGNWIASMRPGTEGMRQWLSAAGEAFAAGVQVLLPANATGRQSNLEVPLYPFDSQTYWFERTTGQSLSVHPVVDEEVSWPGSALDLADPDMSGFETRVPTGELAFLDDHCIDDSVVLPAAGFASLIVSAAHSAGLVKKEQAVSIQDLLFVRPLTLDAAAPARVQVLIRQEGTIGYAKVFGRPQGCDVWNLHAMGKIEVAAVSGANARCLGSDGTLTISPDEFYSFWRERGMAYGPSFQAIQRLEIQGGRAIGTLVLPSGPAHQPSREYAGVVMLDAAFQVVGGLLQERHEDEMRGRIPVPAAIEALHLYAQLPSALKVIATVRTLDPLEGTVIADMQLIGMDNQSLGEITGLRLTLRGSAGEQEPPAQLYMLDWVPKQRAASVGHNGKPWLFVGTPDEALEEMADIEVCGSPLHKPEEVVAWLNDHARQFAGTDAGVLNVLLAADLLASHDTATSSVAARAAEYCVAVQRLLLQLELSEWTSRLRLCWITRQAQGNDVGDVPRCMVQAGLIGMLRAAATELPNLELCILDMPIEASVADWNAGLSAIGQAQEPQIRVRGGQVSVPHIHSFTDRGTSQPIPVRPDGSYLITGGFGGLGLAFCEWLAGRGARHLVLVNRALGSNSELESRLQQLRDRGVKVERIRADIGRQDEVEPVIACFGRVWPSLRGIVHAAGVLEDRPFADVDHDSWQRVAEGKCSGAWHMDQATRGLALDFFVLFSSVAAVLGSAGQSNYSAANAMLEAIALQRAQAGLPCQVVHWGAWAGDGMAHSADLRERLRRLGLPAMQPAQALQAFEKVSTDMRSVIVMACDPERLLRMQATAFRKSLWRKIPGHAAVKGQAYPSVEDLIMQESGEAQRAICNVLVELMAEVLHQPSLIDASGRANAASLRLSALGLDSLMAMDLRNRVRTWLPVDLPAHLLISGANVGEVASVIYEQVLLAAVRRGSSEKGENAPDDEVLVI